MYDVCVVGGCGHVGLPLALALAGKGRRVCAQDLDENAVKTVSSGIMPFMEEGAEPLLRKVLAEGTLTVTSDREAISESETIVFVIGTPVDEHLNPKFSLMQNAAEQYCDYFRDGQLLILRSTLYPGISEKIYRCFVQRVQGPAGRGANQRQDRGGHLEHHEKWRDGLMKILVTGSAGFIAGYLVEELLQRGHAVRGIDNYSKYGFVEKSYDRHPRYEVVKGDVKDTALMKELMEDCDQVVAIAVMIGGITYFHEYAYDLLAENERITASTFDAALWAFREKHLQKINVLSSSMVFENASEYPTPEGAERTSPPPLSTYGFQKLACEYFARGAYEQYGLPYTVIRPFNCVGVGERRAKGEKEILSGNIRLAMSHVVPDLVQKILKGQDPVHILGQGHQIRHYTYAGDLAEGIRMCIENSRSVNDDFNLSLPRVTPTRCWWSWRICRTNSI